ncbi:MAG: flagellar hook-length control protein FliK [bacterium]|nr:flagellar hook-length control protein FliK [bacterium]
MPTLNVADLDARTAGNLSAGTPRAAGVQTSFSQLMQTATDISEHTSPLPTNAGDGSQLLKAASVNPTANQEPVQLVSKVGWQQAPTSCLCFRLGEWVGGEWVGEQASYGIQLPSTDIQQSESLPDNHWHPTSEESKSLASTPSLFPTLVFERAEQEIAGQADVTQLGLSISQEDFARIAEKLATQQIKGDESKLWFLESPLPMRTHLGALGSYVKGHHLTENSVEPPGNLNSLSQNPAADVSGDLWNSQATDASKPTKLVLPTPSLPFDSGVSPDASSPLTVDAAMELISTSVVEEGPRQLPLSLDAGIFSGGSLSSQPGISHGLAVKSSSVGISAPELATQILPTVFRLLESSKSDRANTVHLELQPAELGRIAIQVEHSNAAVSVHIVAAESLSSELLTLHKAELLDSLADAGLENATVDVSQGGSTERRDSGGERARDNKSRDRSPIAADMPAIPQSILLHNALDIVV